MARANGPFPHFHHHSKNLDYHSRLVIHFEKKQRNFVRQFEGQHRCASAKALDEERFGWRSPPISAIRKQTTMNFS